MENDSRSGVTRDVSRLGWGERRVDKRERGVEIKESGVAREASGEGGLNGERVTSGGNCVIV